MEMIVEHRIEILEQQIQTLTGELARARQEESMKVVGMESLVPNIITTKSHAEEMKNRYKGIITLLRVYLVYCDGSSFWGDADGIGPLKPNFYYSGSRIFDVVMEELLAKGMKIVDNAILVGGSAGGLATILHSDTFHALLPNAQPVKCIFNSDFFIHDELNLSRAKEKREDHFTKVGLEDFLPASCTSKINPGLLKDMLTPYIGGGKPEWNNCLDQSLTFCNSTQLETIRGTSSNYEFQKIFIQTLHNLDYSSMRGMFVHTCYLHCHLLEKDEWKCSFVVNNVQKNKTVADAIGD
ncbi:hypothetical protein OROMI_019546 [Orobanche minor]